MLVARFVLGADPVAPWVKNLGLAQGLLTVTAVVIGASWLLLEQPHAMRLKVDETVQVVPSSAGHVMVVAEVSLTNQGVTVIKFNGQPMKVFVQKVSPPPDDVAAEADKMDAAGYRRMFAAENWEGAARIVDVLTFFLQPGESQFEYYRVALPCSDFRNVAVSVRMDRPAAPADFLFGVQDYQFRKQVLADLAPACAIAAPGISK